VIDQVDRELQEWVKSFITEADVILGPPHLLDGKHGVSLYLLTLATPPPAWMNRKPAAHATLRYLVTTWAADDQQAHYLLGKLVQAAMEKREYELDLAELPMTMWTAFGIAPRPAFTLCAPLYGERSEEAPRLVRGPLVLRGSPVKSLRGIVLGPGDIPIAGASVELPALTLNCSTDPRGYFYFPTVPGEQAIQLVARAKGRVQNVTVEQSVSDQELLAIRFDSFER
jgi:hypothetical protein